MTMNKKESLDVTVLREKIRLKKTDRKVYVDEMERLMIGNREKRNALRIGNDCLRFMTRRQNNMSIAINTKIFENRPNNEKLPMMKCDLATSIVKNDGTLFKYGKRLMKHDYKREVENLRKKAIEEERERVLKDTTLSMQEHNAACETYLSQQVRVEAFKRREITAKLIYQKLEQIHAELTKNLMDYPFKIKEVEEKIIDRKKEVHDFSELRDGAMRFLQIEETQLGPLNEELKIVNNHFEKIIAVQKNELDDRRKSNSLAKFLADREAHGFSFTGSSNITEMKIKARNKALSDAYDMLVKMMDAMLVYDVKFVVDSIRDQEDVKKLLAEENERICAERDLLKIDFERLSRNNKILLFNFVKQERERATLEAALQMQKDERKRYEFHDWCLRRQDKLMSDASVALNAMFERLRPIKMPDDVNFFTGNLLKDAENFVLKLKKMKNLIEQKAVPVGRVKPVMLRLFKERRLPGDSVRVEMLPQGGIAGQIQAFDAFESDQPGYTSREMLKARAEELAAKHKKTKAP